mgnify:CR=1 FL=1
MGCAMCKPSSRLFNCLLTEWLQISLFFKCTTPPFNMTSYLTGKGFDPTALFMNSRFARTKFMDAFQKHLSTALRRLEDAYLCAVTNAQTKAPKVWVPPGFGTSSAWVTHHLGRAIFETIVLKSGVVRDVPTKLPNESSIVWTPPKIERRSAMLVALLDGIANVKPTLDLTKASDQKTMDERWAVFVCGEVYAKVDGQLDTATMKKGVLSDRLLNKLAEIVIVSQMAPESEIDADKVREQAAYLVGKIKPAGSKPTESKS